MRNNQLTSIPALTHCVNLKELHLGSNRITSLSPEQLDTILNVRMLDLRENKITKIPDEVHVLQLLERLDVSNNDLSALPFTLGKDRRCLQHNIIVKCVRSAASSEVGPARG